MIKLQPFKVVRLPTLFSRRTDYAEVSRISSGNYYQGFFMLASGRWRICNSVPTRSINPSRRAFYRINKWVRR